MNREQKEKIKKALGLLEESVEILDEVFHEMLQQYAEMTENAQGSEKGENLDKQSEDLGGLSMDLSSVVEALKEFL